MGVILRNNQIMGAILAVISSVQLFAQGWELSEAEKSALSTGTLCYVIDRPGILDARMSGIASGYFERLEVLALKDADGRPNLPFRFKAFIGNQMRECAVFSPREHQWKTTVEKLLVDRNPLPDTKAGMKVGDEEEAVGDGILKVEECDGRSHFTLFPLYTKEHEGFCVEQYEEHIPRVGLRMRQQWCEMDDGLRLKRGESRLMRCESKLADFFASKKYVCASAVYKSERTKSGWIETDDDKEFPFIVKVRIWNVKDEMTREKVLCVARITGCARMNGDEIAEVEYEKGNGELCADIVNSPLHATARSVRLRYKGASTQVFLGSDMSEKELMEFGDNVRKRALERISKERDK